MNNAKMASAELRPAQKYFWRSLPLNHRTGSTVFATLFPAQMEQQYENDTADQISVLLESPSPLPADSLPVGASEMARYSICAGAPRCSEEHTQMWIPKQGKVLPFLAALGKVALPEAVVLDDSAVLPEQLPFRGGWLGWLGYDLAWEIERLPWLKDDTLPFPVAFWYEPAQFAVLHHQAQTLWLAGDTCDRLEQLTHKAISEEPASQDPAREDITKSSTIRSSLPIHSNVSDSIYIGEKTRGEKPKDAEDPDRQCMELTEAFQLATNKDAFEAAVHQAKDYIRAGDVFQVNHSLRFQAQTRLSSWAVYQKLQAINPSPFASYWQTPWGAVVSCSPERLVRLKESRAESRPIAGTRPRGMTRDEDMANAQMLQQDLKEQAEHIMLVDLERNDLGRVCEWGSVQVEELMTIERYSHVMHLVSNVVGELNVDCSASELVAALFPGGTITGCPKVRCMEIIEALEPVRRSLFYGSCGYIDRRGWLDLNILIRTLLMDQPSYTDSTISKAPSTTTVWGQVGAGIVADSDPEREWFESLQKAKAQLLALGL